MPLSGPRGCYCLTDELPSLCKAKEPGSFQAQANLPGFCDWSPFPQRKSFQTLWPEQRAGPVRAGTLAIVTVSTVCCSLSERISTCHHVSKPGCWLYGPHTFPLTPSALWSGHTAPKLQGLIASGHLVGSLCLVSSRAWVCRLPLRHLGTL